MSYTVQLDLSFDEPARADEIILETVKGSPVTVKLEMSILFVSGALAELEAWAANVMQAGIEVDSFGAVTLIF
jgi:hypothetical protein